MAVGNLGTNGQSRRCPVTGFTQTGARLGPPAQLRHCRCFQIGNRSTFWPIPLFHTGNKHLTCAPLDRPSPIQSTFRGFGACMSAPKRHEVISSAETSKAAAFPDPSLWTPYGRTSGVLTVKPIGHPRLLVVSLGASPNSKCRRFRRLAAASVGVPRVSWPIPIGDKNLSEADERADDEIFIFIGECAPPAPPTF